MSARKEKKKRSCAKCSKPLKRINRYYRNGKYFCGTVCFETFTKAAAKESKEQPAQQAK